MGSSTGIKWCDHTFNPVIGCEKVSAGCANCYAEIVAKRGKLGNYTLWGPGSARHVTSLSYWQQPVTWNRKAEREPLAGVRGALAPGRRLVFCGSMFDWADEHPKAADWRALWFNAIRATPNLDWLLLTKRAHRIAQCLPKDWGGGWPNVWLGVSIEGYTEAAANAQCRTGICGCWSCVIARADHLRSVPAVARFVSYEPAIGPLAPHLNLDGLDWIICGGESGSRRRPFDLQWARDMRDACDARGVAWFFKQSADRYPGRGTTLDGQARRAWPVPRAVVEVPDLVGHEAHLS